MKSYVIIFFIVAICILSVASVFGDNSIYNDGNQESISNSKIEQDSSIPYKNTGPGIQKAIVRGILFLILITILAIVSVAVFKKRVSLYNDVKIKKRIRIIEAKRISRETVIFLVGIDDKEYLLSQIGNTGRIERIDSGINDNQRIS